jgi:hypothetical protein
MPRADFTYAAGRSGWQTLAAVVEDEAGGGRLSDEELCASLPLVGATPIEPLEPGEPSTPSSPTGRLYRDDEGSSERLDETAIRLKALGIESLFDPFPCILDGHDHPARVQFLRFKGSRRGYWHYRCEELDRSYGLGEMRAFVAYRKVRDVSTVEAARWRDLLDFEAGMRWPVPLDVQLPEPCPEAARIVAERMAVLVGLRSAHFPLSEAFVFAKPFGAAYCGLSEDQVRAAISWLERAGVIYRDGKHGLSIRWKLRAQDQFCAPNLRDRGHA